MKKITALAAFALFCGVGCSLPFGKAHTGWGVYVYHPPTVDTDMSVLVNPQQTSATAHALGTTAGPIVSGEFSHGAMQVGPQMVAPRISGATGYCDPCPPLAGSPRLTAEQWLAISKTREAKPLPNQE